MPTLKQPYLLPIKFTLINPVEIPQYVSKHMDDWLFVETILPWQQKVTGLQQWQINDTVKLQFQSDYGPINLNLYRCDGSRVHTVSVAQVRQNADFPSFFIYEVSLSFQAFTAGQYYFTVTCGNPVGLTLVSEPFKLSERVENTLLLEYWHRVYKDDVFFETGIQFSVRLPGLIKFKQPKSRDTIYEDQEANMEMLKSVGYDLWELRLGLSAGIPPWLIRRVRDMLGCSTVKIDGRLYTKNEGAEFEETAQENYPMSGWIIEMREKLKRSSVIIETDSNVVGEFVVVISADSKGFGDQDAGSNYLVTDVE